MSGVRILPPQPLSSWPAIDQVPGQGQERAPCRHPPRHPPGAEPLYSQTLRLRQHEIEHIAFSDRSPNRPLTADTPFRILLRLAKEAGVDPQTRLLPQVAPLLRQPPGQCRSEPGHDPDHGRPRRHHKQRPAATSTRPPKRRSRRSCWACPMAQSGGDPNSFRQVGRRGAQENPKHSRAVDSGTHALRGAGDNEGRKVSHG